VPRDRQRFERSADLRYQHQSFELTCRFGEGELTHPRLKELTATFHAEHRRLYSYDIPSATIELVNLRVTAIGRLPQRAAPMPPAAGGDVASAVASRRRVYFRGAGFVDTPCYARERLAPGMAFAGPAVVDQGDATVLVAPGFTARVDPATDIIMERA
jgi:N-methylhydantoinase A